jgi:hypothetical protein
MDVDKFISSGDDGGVSEIKVTIPVNYGWEQLDLKPQVAGDWNKLIETIANSKGVVRAWDNNCEGKLIK